MTDISENGWTLRHISGLALGGAVKSGATVQLLSGRGAMIVVGGRPPQRVNDRGSVIVRNPSEESFGQHEERPAALGLVWISAAGGWSELPPARKQSPPRYCAEAVQPQIERDRRRHKISKKEERLIHALLRGRSPKQ